MISDDNTIIHCQSKSTIRRLCKWVHQFLKSGRNSYGDLEQNVVYYLVFQIVFFKKCVDDCINVVLKDEVDLLKTHSL